MTGSDGPLRRIRKAVLGNLNDILHARARSLRLLHLQQRWNEWTNRFPQPDQSEASVTGNVRGAFETASATVYKQNYGELIRLKNLEPELKSRRELLTQLRHAAPEWAAAIQNRHPQHAMSAPLGDPLAAWEWIQLHDELERRANVSIESLQRQIETLSRELLEVTSLLVEKLTWVCLIRRTTREQKQALGSYAAMRDRLTKTGRGVQDAERRAGARAAMAVAKGAVPVWIMPLNEVAESFDPRSTRFDVVIIDEASQCDPTSMFALYLGQQAVVVGDDEQVTPVAVGVDVEQIQKLRQLHLQGIPAKELYDGDTSIYQFAQIAFGGIIRLVEHFRCAPDIIAFSNSLSYNGEIRPLRESSSAEVSPTCSAVSGRSESWENGGCKYDGSGGCCVPHLCGY